MEKFLVSTLAKNKYFSQPLYLEEKYILLAPETPMTEQMIARLSKWNFSYVLSNGEMVDGLNIESGAVESSFGLEIDSKEKTEFAKAFKFYQKASNATEELFSGYINKSILPVQTVSELVREIIEVVKEQKQYILRITEMTPDDKNYLVAHSVRSSIMAIAVGLQFKLPNHKLIDLGMAAHLHEIGMIKLPSQLYMSNKVLTPQERQAITAHTVLGFKILRAANYPMTVCLAVLESHENVDGSGYPRGLVAEKISQYAKIVSVCSTYAALSSPRPFRHAFDGHQSLVEILKGTNKRYDDATVKSLLTLLSLFPMGTYVQLANGAIGMVVQANEENAREPVVKILIGPNKEKLSDSLVVKTETSEYKIARALSVQQTAELKKYYNIQ